MAFDVHHNPTAAAIGNVATQAGLGQFQNLLAQRQIQNRQLDIQADSLDFRRQDAAASRQFQTARDKDYQKFQLEMGREQQKIRHEDFEFKYSAQQRLRIKQINQDIETLEADESLTDEQKSIARDQLNALRYGINKQPIPKAQSPYPQGQNVGENWVDKSGSLMTRDRNGNSKVLVKPTDASKLYESLMKSMSTKNTAGDNVPPSHADVMARVKEVVLYQREQLGQGADIGERAIQSAQEGQRISGQPLPSEQENRQMLDLVGEAGEQARAERIQTERTQAREEIDDPLSSRPKMIPSVNEAGNRGVRQETQAEVKERITRNLREDDRPPDFERLVGEAGTAAGQEQATRQQVMERLVEEINLDDTAQKQLKKNDGLIDKAISTGKKVAGLKAIDGGLWHGKFFSAEDKMRKDQFRDQNAAVISRAMSLMNQDAVPAEVRKDMREVVQELLSVLREADYEIPDPNPHQALSRTEPKTSVANRTRAEKLGAVLVDFLNQPERFTRR